MVTYFTCQRFLGKEINQDHEVCMAEIQGYTGTKKKDL
jgi:hypothetical protein